ncbi:MAG: DUF4258 domain-containing protein [Pseudanabaenaceae cyanobacterium bins.39]|nr:DUF4258 domain-containing protein [Pseudanabaenaceae cyanobacterium bins.39]
MSQQPDGFPYEISVHAKKRIDERDILLTWIQETIERSDKTESDQNDPELEIAFKRIESYGGRVLKVIYNKTVSPIRIVTLHFDRSMKGKI